VVFFFKNLLYLLDFNDIFILLKDMVVYFFSYLLFFLYYIKQSRFYNLIWTCIISFIIFLFVVLIRIATPRFKLESLSKLGWMYGLLIIFLAILFFYIGYFFI
jgi:hypothetical protein